MEDWFWDKYTKVIANRLVITMKNFGDIISFVCGKQRLEQMYGSQQVSRQNKKPTAKKKNHGRTKKPRQNKKTTAKQKSYCKIKKRRQNKEAATK